MNVSAGAEDKTWREPKDDVIQIGKTRGSRAEEVSSRVLRHGDVIAGVATAIMPVL